ncbi:hypothetical protein HNQ59_003435 [Chitinivorax tropicus]|uniref:Copper chaperone PCu(A)C n=1 Tax=Chitinivorax tropicus TaxID=714531 RepID=A0A840MY95_9PROT|nr:copper chaperone PCu(A)C [Chitinivorax tropicus]MBB5020121.1 hypothetical protein [Chitinivorax tropicus]
MKSRLALSVLAWSLVGSVFAHDFKQSGLTVDHPWARASTPGAQMGAVYMKINNAGKTADALLEASSPSLAEEIEIHNHINDNGVMRMRQVPQVAVPAGGTVMLKPHSYHIMLFGLKKPLVVGDVVPMTLRFKQAGEVKVEVTVEPIDADPATMHGTHGS